MDFVCSLRWAGVKSSLFTHRILTTFHQSKHVHCKSPIFTIHRHFHITCHILTSSSPFTIHPHDIHHLLSQKNTISTLFRHIFIFFSPIQTPTKFTIHSITSPPLFPTKHLIICTIPLFIPPLFTRLSNSKVDISGTTFFMRDRERSLTYSSR